MAFVPIKNYGGKVQLFQTVAGTHTITKGDGLEFSAGYVQRTTTTARPLLIAAESVSSVGTALAIKCYVIDPTMEFVADTNSTMSQSLVGEKCVMTDYDTINEADTASGYIFLTGMVSSSKARCKFQYVS